MQFKLKETNELKRLGLKHTNGMDWFPETLLQEFLRKNSDGDYIVTQDEYETIRKYIVDYFINEEEIFAITVEFDILESEIRNRVHEAIEGQEIEQHHLITKAILSDIREEELTRVSKNYNELEGR